ncbi:MAG: type II CRISPR RNA-guided endonuclease Cas9 [Candidatus Accumulibacter sp.]|jgi:CRISPR-associated endonuclease Csn1|nr:type II CRISPR RNA-guided endonuclease Cas9 [Accumulibacter sp.]
MLRYTLGLDIGIASVGWGVLGDAWIVDLGVRTFDKAETADSGESLNKARRDARLARHRLAHRAERLKKLARLLKKHGLVDSPRFFQPPKKGDAPNENHGASRSPWLLRIEGLDRKLEKGEWARVIYHIAKHRGFYWMSRAEEAKADGDKNEGKKVKKSLEAIRRLFKAEGKEYRTLAELVVSEFPEAQRNKRGEYTKALPRVLLAEELNLLFERQRDFGNPHATPQLQTDVLGTGDRKTGLFWIQKPALSGEALLKMLGKCTFEKDEYRAPKASFTAERHVWLTRLNNLRIVADGVARPLTAEERAAVLHLPYEKEKLSYKQLGDALVKAGLLAKDAYRFAGLSYASKAQQAEGKAKNPEDDKLAELSGWHELRKAFKNKRLKHEWQSLSGKALAGEPETLDRIAFVLSVHKEDDEARCELEKLDLPNKPAVIEALLCLRFDKFHALSLKALRNIVPKMEQGMRYDEAVKEAGYGHHSQLFKAGAGDKLYLPSLYDGRDDKGRMKFRDEDVPRNPVVLRALNQARKVVNAVIRRYGSPAAVHIELARDLSRSLEEWQKIEKEQKAYRDRNDQAAADFIRHCGGTPGDDGRAPGLLKYLLYREQDGKCAYSQKAIDIERLLEPGYVEVDHALPYSRSFDDGKNNKVLTLTKENRDKGNRTPWEYLTSFPGGEEGERWRNFAAFVQSNPKYRQAKKNRLLRKHFGGEDAKEFRDRNLNDTRYICRFFKNYVERHLQLAEDSGARRCVVLSGQLTSLLRARWGLLKAREESDRHHALDAVVIAACSHGMVKRMSDYAQRRELEFVPQGTIDMETGEVADIAALQKLERDFPKPWPHFREELLVRLNTDDPDKLKEEMRTRFGYPAEALENVRPLFVSRAPQRRNGGAAHKDTIYGQPECLKPSGTVTQKVALADLKLADLDNLVEPHRNERLYQAIRERLEAHNGNGKKAFPDGEAFRKPFALDKEGKPITERNGKPIFQPVVRTVTMNIGKMSGIPVRGGIAKNDSMLRVDVFQKAGKFYLIPVYVYHRVVGLPNRAVIAHKNESEWTEIDASFEWCFSVWPNDLIRITTKKGIFLGYYDGTDRASGNVSIWIHDRNKTVGTGGLIRGIGVKTALKLEKFQVDALGNIYSARPEPRRGLA